MNAAKQNEEILRQASAIGDTEGVQTLIDGGTDINAQHNLNGWTALHWAAKRGHTSVVLYLLSKGADPTLKSLYGESAFAVAKNDEIRELLSASTDTSSETPKVSTLPITPNYLANPPLAAKLQVQDCVISQSPKMISSMANNNAQCFEEELVLKVRTSDPPDQDFIEIEIPMKNLTYENVVRISCEELQIVPKNVLKLRKLPNTVMRKDKDVHRLQNFQEVELVLVGSSRPHTAMTYPSNSISRLEINGHDRITSEIASSPFASKSNYCKNGTILY